MTCTCGHLVVGSKVTEVRNWSPDCEEHGLDSEWWHSTEQVERRLRASERLRALQAEARRRRQQG